MKKAEYHFFKGIESYHYLISLDYLNGTKYSYYPSFPNFIPENLLKMRCHK